MTVVDEECQAGMFVVKAALDGLGFNEAFTVEPSTGSLPSTTPGSAPSDSHGHGGLRFEPRQIGDTLAWMAIKGIDAPYQLNETDLHDLALYLDVKRPPLKDDVYAYYRQVTEEQATQLVDRLAVLYQRTGLIHCTLVFFDVHTIPYFGRSAIGIVHHATRNVNIPGLKLLQLNDRNGLFIIFELGAADTGYFDAAVRLLIRLKNVLGLERFPIAVFDREAASLPFHLELDRMGVFFIVAIKRPEKVIEDFSKIPERAFNKHLRKYERIVDTRYRLGWKRWRAGIILNDDGSRYGFHTNIPRHVERDIARIGINIPLRWRQENKFEEGKNSCNIDKIARYEIIDAPNIRLQKQYDKLIEKAKDLEVWILKKKERVQDILSRIDRKVGVMNRKLKENEKKVEKTEERVRRTKSPSAFRGRLQKLMDKRVETISSYNEYIDGHSAGLRDEEEKLARHQMRWGKIGEQLENIDLEGDFFHLNTASTTVSIGVKEAIMNVNQVITQVFNSDGQPTKFARARRVLYSLRGHVFVDDEIMDILLFKPRKPSSGAGVERVCKWLNEKGIRDEKGRIYRFRVVEKTA